MKFRNPILYGDYSDPDVIRVGEDFYMISSSFTYLPGINTKKAKSMVRYRNKNGDYTAIEDLKKLSWFNDKLFEKVKGKVYVDGDEEKA